MFKHQRKARVLFELSDIILAAIAFQIAYHIRVPRRLHFLFYLTLLQKALILGFSLFAWVTLCCGSDRGANPVATFPRDRLPKRVALHMH